MDHGVASINCIHLSTLTMTVGTIMDYTWILGTPFFTQSYVTSFSSKQRQQVLCQFVYDYSQLQHKIDNIYHLSPVQALSLSPNAMLSEREGPKTIICACL